MSTLVAGTLMVGVALADQAHPDQASVRLRATGKTATVEIVHAADGGELPSDVQAGVIARARLQAELDRGIGRFLRNVPVRAELSHGHFVGWKLLALFPGRSDVAVSVLKAGDVILRVNGASIEHPEAFKDVWDGLRTAPELVLEIERAGQHSTLRYQISG